MQEQSKSKIKKKTVSVGNVALLLMGTMLLSQILGFLRTRLVNANFSAIGPHSTDAYFAAFNIPDLFFYTVAAGAISVAVIPVLTDRLHKTDKRAMWESLNNLLNCLMIVMFVVGVFILIFAKTLIHHIVAPNFTPEQLNTATDIMRLLAFNPFFFTVSGLLVAGQQTIGRFFFYAISPLFYNVAIIISVYVFKNTSIGIEGLGIGACIGAMLQLSVVSIGLIGTRFYWRPKIKWHSPDFKTMVRNLPPRSVDQGIDQVQAIVETNFARRLGQGNVSYYNNALTLQSAPILLLGNAIATAAFPRFSKRLSQGRPDLFRSDFLKTLRVMIWLTVPVVIVSYFGRGYLARLIFSRNAPQIALIFGFLTVAIFFRVMYTVISRWFYAQKDTKTPLLVSLFVIGLDIALVSMLARPNTYGVAGLGIAQSIAGMSEVIILVTIMLMRDHKLFDREFLGAMLRILSVAGFSMLAGYVAIGFLPLGVNERGLFALGSRLGLITACVFAIYLSISALFGLDEARIFFTRVKRIALKPIKVQY